MCTISPPAMILIPKAVQILPFEASESKLFGAICFVAASVFDSTGIVEDFEVMLGKVKKTVRSLASITDLWMEETSNSRRNIAGMHKKIDFPCCAHI